MQHRSRVRKDPNQPNLRQVHLLQAKLFDKAREHGYELAPGNLGENILTEGVDLLALPTGTRLTMGERSCASPVCSTPDGTSTTSSPG